MKPKFVLAAAAILFMASFVLVFLSGTRAGILSDSPALLREVQRLNELVTVQYSIQKVVGLEEQKRPLGTEKLLLITQAKVLAGVDLAALVPADLILANPKQPLLRLPPAKILHIVLDEKQTKVWDRQVTWWTPWVPFSVDLESRARQAAIESIQQAALDMGILAEAEKNARMSIRSLLQSAGAKQVNFSPPS